MIIYLDIGIKNLILVLGMEYFMINKRIKKRVRIMLKMFRQWLNRNREPKKYVIYFGQSEFDTPVYGLIGMKNRKKSMNQIYCSHKNLVIPNEYTKEEIVEVNEYYMRFAYDIKDRL